MKRLLLILVCVFGLSLSDAVVAPVFACPMCKEANEADDPRPRAYMYSILFMMSMPALLLAGFGVGLYRISRSPQPLVEEQGDLGETGLSK